MPVVSENSKTYENEKKHRIITQQATRQRQEINVCSWFTN